MNSTSKMCSRTCRHTRLIFKPNKIYFTLRKIIFAVPNTDFQLEYFYNNETKDVKTLQAKTGLPLSTIYRKIKVLREKGELKRKEGSGRPRIFSGNSKKAISQIAVKNPTFSAQDITDRFEAKSNIVASRRTYSITLQSCGKVKGARKSTEHNKNSRAKEKGLLHPVQRARVSQKGVPDRRVNLPVELQKHN